MSVSRKLEIETVDTDNLKTVLPGSTVQLQFSSPDSVRLPAKLIGYDHKKYLIVKLLEPEHWSRYQRSFYENNQVVARMVVDDKRGECIAFATRIRWKGVNPLDFLYLSFPQTLQKCEFRNHPRVSTCIIGKLNGLSKAKASETGQSGVIKDISLGGCCFEFELPPNYVRITQKSFNVRAGDNEGICVEVRNQRPVSPSRIAVGLQFRSSLTDIKKLLSRLYIAPEMLVAQISQ